MPPMLKNMIRPHAVPSAKLELLGNFCTVNPDNYTEAKFNHLKLMRKYFGT
jgi:hypothetical protein